MPISSVLQQLPLQRQSWPQVKARPETERSTAGWHKPQMRIPGGQPGGRGSLWGHHRHFPGPVQGRYRIQLLSGFRICLHEKQPCPLGQCSWVLNPHKDNTEVMLKTSARLDTFQPGRSEALQYLLACKPLLTIHQPTKPWVPPIRKSNANRLARCSLILPLAAK